MTSSRTPLTVMGAFQQFHDMVDLTKILMGMAVFAVGAGCTFVPTLANPLSSQDPSPSATEKAADDTDLAKLRDQVVAAHNRIRADAKLPPLTISPKLQAAAEAHARDMAARGQMTHTGKNGSRPIDRIKAQRYPYRRAGENVAVGRFNVERLMKGWMDSPRHKRNILGGFSQIGVACATGEDGKRYWCVTFGLPIRH
jgi:uncharacterized protein YkwD